MERVNFSLTERKLCTIDTRLINGSDFQMDELHHPNVTDFILLNQHHMRVVHATKPIVIVARLTLQIFLQVVCPSNVYISSVSWLKLVNHFGFPLFTFTSNI